MQILLKSTTPSSVPRFQEKCLAMCKLSGLGLPWYAQIQVPCLVGELYLTISFDARPVQAERPW